MSGQCFSIVYELKQRLLSPSSGLHARHAKLQHLVGTAINVPGRQTVVLIAAIFIILLSFAADNALVRASCWLTAVYNYKTSWGLHRYLSSKDSRCLVAARFSSVTLLYRAHKAETQFGIFQHLSEHIAIDATFLRMHLAVPK